MKSCVDCKRFKPDQEYVTFYKCEDGRHEANVPNVPSFFTAQAKLLAIHQAAEIGSNCPCFDSRSGKGVVMNGSLVKKAKAYFYVHSLSHGVVLFFEESIYGWKNGLHDPKSVVPGVIGVDIDGNQWVAVGGNDCDGAECWRPLVQQGGV